MMNPRPVVAAPNRGRAAGIAHAALLPASTALWLLPLLLVATTPLAAAAASAESVAIDSASASTSAGKAGSNIGGKNAGTANARRDATLLEGNGVKVTAADVLAEILRVPPETRDQLFRDLNNIAQIASNIYVRRVLAAEAEKDGRANDSLIEAQLRIARERVLSDAQLAHIDEKSRPVDSMIEQYAKTTYQAEPKRFAMPDEVHARHILIQGTGDKSREKAGKLLAELKANGGADFEAVARQESQDPGSAPNGGDLGFFGRGRMVKSFEDAAFDLSKPGELSGIVESSFGFHIIQLVERRSAGTRPFAEVENALRAEAMQKVMAEARTAKAKALLADATFNRAAIEALGKAEQQQQQQSSPEKPVQ